MPAGGRIRYVRSVSRIIVGRRVVLWPEVPHSARVFALRTGDEVPPTNWKRSVDS